MSAFVKILSQLNPAAPRDRDRVWRPRPLADAALVLAGAALVALSFNLLLRPNGITPGGLPGFSLLLLAWFGWEPALSQAGMNILLLLAAWRWLGGRFALQSVLGCIALPVFVALTRDWAPLTQDHLLAAICGAGGTGVGVGLVFRGHGSVGGFSTVAMMLHRTRGWPVDRVLWTFDGVVVLLAATLFPADAVLASLVGVVLIGRTARAVLTGFDTATFALIVSNDSARVQAMVLKELDLGLTVIPAKGGYTGEGRELLMVVMHPEDVPRLKAQVRAIDPSAFLVLASSSEVLGHGFKPHL